TSPYPLATREGPHPRRHLPSLLRRWPDPGNARLDWRARRQRPGANYARCLRARRTVAPGARLGCGVGTGAVRAAPSSASRAASPQTAWEGVRLPGPPREERAFDPATGQALPGVERVFDPVTGMELFSFPVRGLLDPVCYSYYVGPTYSVIPTAIGR